MNPTWQRRRAHAKLNLGLEVLGRRQDGFHEIATVFQEIDLHDDLVVEAAEDLSLEVEGLPGAGSGEDNLVLRAARLLAEAAGRAPEARLRLVKRIPVGAGLGGGSSDAAAALLALGRLWKLTWGLDRLLPLAARLGSDVPFFLVGGTVLGLGRGETICPLPDLPPWHVVVVCPHRGLATKSVYERGGFSLTAPRNCNIIRRFAKYHLTGDGLDELIGNDLQAPAVEMLPEIRRWIGFLEDGGAEAAAMTGSGSSVFGLFRDAAGARSVAGRVSGDATAHLCTFRARPVRG